MKTSTPRLESLDLIRGIAVLGILLMNIQSFSMIGQAYLNPTAFGDLTGANLWVFVGSHLLADQKFMSIFSMLFGASMLLIIQNSERKGLQPGKVHYRRNFWLLIIGLLHAYLIWYGDILTPYALCAFLVYPAYGASPKRLFVVGIIIFSIASLLESMIGLTLPYWPEVARESLTSSWLPEPSTVQAEIAAYQGNYLSQLSMRAASAFGMQTTYFLNHFLWRISGLMLIGMALFKSGFLIGAGTRKMYRKVAIGIGLPSLFLVGLGLWLNFRMDWSVSYSFFLGSQFNYWGSLGVAIGFMALIVLWHQSHQGQGWKRRFSTVGRMALSNYLIQSILGAFLFYGLGWFGEVNRVQQLWIVLGVWALQLLYSPWWMQRYHYGPFEWVWRSLTQGKKQPWRKTTNLSAKTN